MELNNLRKCKRQAYKCHQTIHQKRTKKHLKNPPRTKKYNFKTYNLQLSRMTIRVYTLFFAVVFFGSRPHPTSAVTLTIVPPFSLPLTLYSLCVAAMQGWTRIIHPLQQNRPFLLNRSLIFKTHEKKTAKTFLQVKMLHL